MADLERLSESTDEHEGFRALPYLDSKNLWTFGKGRCLERNPLTVHEWRHLLNNSYLTVSITEKGADWLKWRTLNAAVYECMTAFPFWNKLNDARQNVLIEMVYQMGIGSLALKTGLLGFTEMLKAIEAQDWQKAYREGLDSDWHRTDSPGRARKLMLQLRDGKFSD